MSKTILKTISKPTKITLIEAHRLRNNWTYGQKVWLKQKSVHKLDRWTLVLSSSIKEVGVCNYTNKTITLSSIFMRGYNCNYKKVRKALMHEVAHAITPGHKHGPVWKQKCRQIGGDSRLAISMVLPGMKWAMVCSKCKWRQEYPNEPKVTGSKVMVCGKCHTPVRIKYIK